MGQVTGAVFYEGLSLLDGAPIVGVVTFDTSNQKTGNLVQTWILRSDIPPIKAINTGEDASICGACPLRGRVEPDAKNGSVNRGRGCYVSIRHAPGAVYRSYKAGKYPVLDDSHRRRMLGKGVRYGSYGDPAALPLEAWDHLLRLCPGRSRPGYTHQWRDDRFAAWSNRVMASTHSMEENVQAWAAGWRTFRTVARVEDVSPEEVICPASPEGGHKSNCFVCGLCDGRRQGGPRKSVAIVAHGAPNLLPSVLKVIS